MNAANGPSRGTLPGSDAFATAIMWNAIWEWCPSSERIQNRTPLSNWSRCGAKEFHLIAEPVKQELMPGKIANLWDHDGSAAGPTIQVNQGDWVRIIVDNHFPVATSMHWHGFEIPIHTDGPPNAWFPEVRQSAEPRGRESAD